MGTRGADYEGAERGAVGAKRCSAKGGLRYTVSAVWGLRPQKIFEIYLANLCIFMHFRASLYAESNAACSKFGSVIVQ